MRNKDIQPRTASPVKPIPKFCQHLRAPNDTNGNPRRCYVVYDDNGGVLDVIDEGYSGLPKALRNIAHLPDIEVEAKTYREWVKEFNDRDASDE